MTSNFLHHALAAGLLVAAGAAGAAPFAAPGTQGTLTVDFVYESAGKSGDRNDERVWNVRHTLSMRTELAAQPATALSQFQAAGAAEVAGLKRQHEQAQRAAADAAPMMAEAEKIVARCGEDQACIERATRQLGFGMAGSPELAQAQAAGRAGVEAAGRQGAPRYQAWLAKAETGTYSVDDTMRFDYGEMQCAKFARGRCTRTEVRKGSGPVPELRAGAGGLAGIGAVEFDTQKNTLALRLPTAAGGLPYLATITSNDPGAQGDAKPTQAAQPRRIAFRVTADGGNAPVVLPLSGAGADPSGEYVVAMPGKGEEGGKLTVRWRFVAR